MNIVLLGSPGAGKGTQALRIAKEHNFAHISTGDIFRAELKNNTPLGQKAKEYMDKGALVPDELVVDMVNNKISSLEGFNGTLLDGFPRNIAQAMAMEGKINVDMVIYIDVDRQEIIKRLTSRRTCKKCSNIQSVTPDNKCVLCGGETYQREDDTQSVIENRLNVYEEQTMPLIGYYQNKDILFDINGQRDVEVIYDEIVNLLEK